MSDHTCVIDGCDKPSRNTHSAAMCKMHYHREYRHGDCQMVASQSDVTVSLGRRYKRVTASGHPLADADGRLYEHRKVLFDVIGEGPHPCHWCEILVQWLPRWSPGELQVDHLSNDGADNRPSNLVPSCRACNTARGSQRRAVALRDAGWWSEHDTVALTGGGRTLRVEDRRTTSHAA